MIDWITAILPLTHEKPLFGGHVMSIYPDGSHEWTVNKKLEVKGSYDNALHIKTDDSKYDENTGFYTHLYFSGNPVKFLQGHNLFGTDDITGLVSETILRISDLLQIPIPYDELAMIENGFFDLKRVDCTLMLELGSQTDVEAFLHAAERQAHMKHKGQGIMTKGTLYWGKHSRRDSLKMYNKFKEIQAKGHQLPAGLDSLPQLIEWTKTKLRVEVTLRALTLKSLLLHRASYWDDNTSERITISMMERINMSENLTLSDSAVNSLPLRLRGVYQLWVDGHDLRSMMAKPTFYRNRKELLDAVGIDIAIRQNGGVTKSPNVIDFRRVLIPERVQGPPDWAFGTDLYFEPRAKIAR